MKPFVDKFVKFIWELYRSETVDLHNPFFDEDDGFGVHRCVNEFAVAPGKRATTFENNVKDFTGHKYAIAVSSGTAALHLSLLAAGVKPGDSVITQAFTFVATANAISYCGADPVFVDVDHTLCMDSGKLDEYLRANKGAVKACIPVHVFGYPARARELWRICNEHDISLIEDACQGLGSFNDECHVGMDGELACLSFNANKIVTTGAGGMVLTNYSDLAGRVRHLACTAKQAHPYLYNHDRIGFNYRMPDLNAALGITQIGKIETILEKKKAHKEVLQMAFGEFFHALDDKLNTPNYWLNNFFIDNVEWRDFFLAETNDAGIKTRAPWTPLHKLSMYGDCKRGDLTNTEYYANRLASIPSGIPREYYGS